MEKPIAGIDVNIKYCSKSETSLPDSFKEFGTPPKKHNTLKKVKDLLKDGKTHNEIFLEEPDLAFKHRQYIDYHIEQSALAKDKQDFQAIYKDKPLRPIQEYWLRLLEAQEPRKVLWLYDRVGNCGKSWFANWLAVNKGACIMENAKTSDLAYMYNAETVVCIDYTRSVEGRVNYTVIEALKNGRILSAKYHTKLKLFLPPKVIVMSNFWPEMDKLSEDRWQIVDCAAPIV